jgi:hypothetical protein
LAAISWSRRKTSTTPSGSQPNSRARWENGRGAAGHRTLGCAGRQGEMNHKP